MFSRTHRRSGGASNLDLWGPSDEMQECLGAVSRAAQSGFSVVPLCEPIGRLEGFLNPNMCQVPPLV